MILISYIIITLISLISCVSIAWLIYLWKKNPSIIDVFWSLSIAMSMTITGIILNAQTNFWIITIMILLWASRLSLYLFVTKIYQNHQDIRYIKMINRWGEKSNFKFYQNMIIQATLQWVLVSSFYSLLHQNTSPNLLTYISIIIIIIGIIGEWIADYQLYRHKKINSSICQNGLWRLSRHPNIFFEIIIWFGFVLLGTSLNGHWTTFNGLMGTFIICKFITCPYTEKCSIEKHKDAYSKYQKKTPMIFPFIRKK